jgi:sulfatase maturation enzyme AslB (radical SAM superfamily)
LLAGEPLLEPITFEILEKLLESDNTECFVSITTNGSIILNTQKLDMLKKFKKLNINVSVDGLGPVFEYLRYPLNWKEVVENIAVFRTIADTVSVSYTISNLNVLYHRETTKWFHDQNLDYILNPVINPSYFRPGALIDSVKQNILDTQGTTKDLDFLLNTNNSPKDELDFHRMLTEVKLQDSWKNINIKDYLPEFYNLIAEYY